MESHFGHVPAREERGGGDMKTEAHLFVQHHRRSRGYKDQKPTTLPLLSCIRADSRSIEELSRSRHKKERESRQTVSSFFPNKIQ